MVNVEDGHEAQSGDKEYSYKTITNPIFDDFYGQMFLKIICEIYSFPYFLFSSHFISMGIPQSSTFYFNLLLLLYFY